MCIKDDGTSMQWQIQLRSVEVAPTELVHLPTNDRPLLHEFINANINQFASHANLCFTWTTQCLWKRDIALYNIFLCIIHIIYVLFLQVRVA